MICHRIPKSKIASHSRRLAGRPQSIARCQVARFKEKIIPPTISRSAFDIDIDIWDLRFAVLGEDLPQRSPEMPNARPFEI